MKHYRAITGTLLLLSCVLVLYIAYATGILGYTDLSANDQGNAASAVEDQQIEAKRRERVMSEKESILKEQIVRYEALIVELRSKLEKKEKEYQASISDKDRAHKSSLADLEKQIRELKTQQEKNTELRNQTYRTIYEKMDSKKAAKIMDEMDVSVAAAILENIKQDKAADILSKMSSERARLITERANSKRRPSSQKVSSPQDSKINLAVEEIQKGGE